MRRKLLFVAAFLMAFSYVNAQYSVLLVDDDANGADESSRIDTALAHSGYTYSFINIDTNATPSYADLKDYDMVIWTTANDGADLHLWDVSDTAANGAGAIKFNAALQQYVDSGKVVWVDGIDFMYDIYKKTPTTFAAGDFVYDVMGIQTYVAQSHKDDSLGSFTGLPMDLKAATNTITTLDTIRWKWSSLWYGDAFDVTPATTVLYEMGPATYDFAGKASMFYLYNVITSSMRIGSIGDTHNYVQGDLDILVKEMVDAAAAGTFVNPTIGIDEAKNTISKVTVYPNPATNRVTFAIPAQNAIVAVYDITGKVIFNQSVEVNGGLFNLDISNLNSGMYFYNVTVDNSSVTGKFSVVK